MKGRVVKSTGSWYAIELENGKRIDARIKGLFKIDDITSTNPVAVGDWVEVDIDEVEDKAIIHTIYDRENYIARISPHNKNQRHIVAANIQLALILVTLKHPKTSNGFIDRFLLACEFYHLPAIIVFNKSDLFGPKEWDLYNSYKAMYEQAGYLTYLTQLDKANTEELMPILQHLSHKTTLLFGHSGVGKTTLINRLKPTEQTLKTQEVSKWSGKGMHTTTFAELYRLANNIQLIDTPGIREFGLLDTNKQELSHYFPEMRQLLNQCKYNNCIHVADMGCAVKQAVVQQTISELRYISYLNILDTIEK